MAQGASWPRVVGKRSPRRFARLPFTLPFFWGMCLLTSAAAGPGPGHAEAGHPTTGTAEDLTALSLKSLLGEEITPINVLGTHTHVKGDFMIGYRYMLMEMRGNLEGDRKVSDEEVLQRYPVVHTAMTMEMHMVELMYAPTEQLTLELMLPVKVNSMDHLDRTGETFTAKSSGLGDLSLMGLYEVCSGHAGGAHHRLIANAGLSIPTGSIDEESTHGGVTSRLEYPMQLGSGTVDLLLGATYLGEKERLAWGAQAMGLVRFGQNANDYRLGDSYRVNAWGHYGFTDWLGASVRLDWRQWFNVVGADPALNPARNPAFDADKQEGRRLDILAGLDVYVNRGVLRGLRFSVEGGVPAYQWLAGPTIKTEWLLNAAVSHSFR